jgi:anti-sigma factor ChrR (cupin superfamily)
MLTCREIAELVTEYAEGGLSLADRIRFQMHLGMCRSCRRYVRQVKATVAALGRLPAPDMSAELEGELLRRFETWTKTRGA